MGRTNCILASISILETHDQIVWLREIIPHRFVIAEIFANHKNLTSMPEDFLLFHIL